ncbi:MAG TPA: hypothetical protein VLF89_07840 [Candidatus Saccharimonadales bacterium]|nr:hypothetical protein [Candidatus Saccharimonadales bacterium]
MKKRKIILFDIDHTMFDASLYRKLMFDLITDYLAFEDRGKLHQTLEEIYISHRKKLGYFDLEILLEELVQQLAIEADTKAVFEAVLKDKESYQRAIFDETVSVLEEIAQHKDITLGIFSGGREEHQFRKIENFIHLFDKEHINILKMKERDLPEIMKKYIHDRLYLVDDILQILYNAKKSHGDITTIWMKRGPIAAQQDRIQNFTPEYTVSNLREVVPIILGK